MTVLQRQGKKQFNHSRSLCKKISEVVHKLLRKEILDELRFEGRIRNLLFLTRIKSRVRFDF